MMSWGETCISANGSLLLTGSNVKFTLDITPVEAKDMMTKILAAGGKVSPC